MNIIKKIIQQTTGYWVHKLKTLPIGADLFYDITQRLNYGNLQTVFDVGANEGQTVKWIKHHQPNAHIFSFEPVSTTFEKLKQQVGKYQDCRWEKLALGEAKGEKKIKLFSDYSVLNSLNENAMNHDADAREEIIIIDTLDNYCKNKNINKIDLLKIDTEGYELNVLQGAEQMLVEKRISFIYCEVGFNTSNKRNSFFETIRSYLEERDYFFYSLYQIDGHGWQNCNNFANALFINKTIYPADR